MFRCANCGNCDDKSECINHPENPFDLVCIGCAADMAIDYYIAAMEVPRFNPSHPLMHYNDGLQYWIEQVEKEVGELYTEAKQQFFANCADWLDRNCPAWMEETAKAGV